MTPGSLASSPGSRAIAQRFAGAARRAVQTCAAEGRQLDQAAGAAAALGLIADEAAALPLPGCGNTEARWSALAAVAAVDVTLGRLFEAHCDAVAILAELHGIPAAPSQRWAVWAAEGPASTVGAAPAGDAWRLDGQKPWCSGAAGCSHALVTADSPLGRALFAVAVDDDDTVVADSASWQATGLTGTATYTVTFSGTPATLVGKPGSYLTRPGFWHGGAGVAAVWWGGAGAVAAPLYDRVGSGRGDAFACAHLGAVDLALTGTAALLRETAADIDRHPEIPSDGNALRALRVRAAATRAAEDVLTHAARALGPAPLCQDRPHARAVADLSLYIRQGHAERDLARIGEFAAGAPDTHAADA